MSKSKRERLLDEQVRLAGAIAAQRRWIEEHGGDRAGYIDRYGMKRSEGCHLPRWTDPGDGCQHPIHDGPVYGDGGDVIWAADKGELDRLEAAYVEVRRQQGVTT